MTTALSLQARAAMLIDSAWAPAAPAASNAPRLKSGPVPEVANLSAALGAASSRLNMPPAAKAPVSQLEATQALSRMLANVKPASQTSAPMSLKALEKVPMDSIMLASTLLSGEILGSTALAKSKALAIMTDKQESIRQQEIRDCREEMDKAVEQQSKARKADIFSVIFDWVVAAVEVVGGVVKLVGGVLTGNVSTVLGGGADLLAGLAGIVKATANTLALIDPDNADEYKKVAKVAGDVQMYLEIAGALVDVASAARNLFVTKVIPNATRTAMEKGGAAVLAKAVKKGTPEAVNQAAQQIGKEVAAQVAAQIAQKLNKAALTASKASARSSLQTFVQQFGANQMLKKFSQEAIEQMVTKAVTKVGTDAAKKGAQITVEKLTGSVVQAVWNDVIAAVIKASTYVAVPAVRSGVSVATKITDGALAMDRARLQKEINQLVLDQQWLQSLFALYKSEKEAAMKRIAELMEGQSQVLEDGSKAIAQAGAVQVQIASAMV